MIPGLPGPPRAHPLSAPWHYAPGVLLRHCDRALLVESLCIASLSLSLSLSFSTDDAIPCAPMICVHRYRGQVERALSMGTLAMAPSPHGTVCCEGDPVADECNTPCQRFYHSIFWGICFFFSFFGGIRSAFYIWLQEQLSEPQII